MKKREKERENYEVKGRVEIGGSMFEEFRTLSNDTRRVVGGSLRGKHTSNVITKNV